MLADEENPTYEIDWIKGCFWPISGVGTADGAHMDVSHFSCKCHGATAFGNRSGQWLSTPARSSRSALVVRSRTDLPLRRETGGIGSFGLSVSEELPPGIWDAG